MSKRHPTPSQEPEELPAGAPAGAATDRAAVPAVPIFSKPETEKVVPLPIPLFSEEKAREARRARVAAVLERTPAEQLESAKLDGRTQQGSLLVMVPIREGQIEPLRKLLAQVASPPDGDDFEINPVIPFLKLRTVHFARFLIHAPSPSEEAPIPVWDGKPQVHGPPIPAKLLFSTDYDGELDAHLEELFRVAGPGLDRIFSHCEGWPGNHNPRLARGYFLRHRYPTTAFYTGTMRRSVEQIRREADLRDRIQAFLDRESGKPGFPSDPVEVRERIRQFVSREKELAWAREKPGPFPKLLIPEYFINRLPLTAGLAGLTVATGAFGALSLVLPMKTAAAWVGGVTATLGAAVGAGYAYLSRLAARDPVIIRDSVKEHTAELVKTEDRIVQNEMSSVIYIKEPLAFRRTLLWVVLTFVNFAAKYLSNQGALAGIPSIHFARWVIVDEGRRLIFFSNFDGSWENYLGDFVDKAHDGLTAVWSNCVGFPRTKGLWQEGATDEQKFKMYSRDSQIPTQVWYSAYKWLSVPNINNNTMIRLGLYGELSRTQAEEWLRRF
ncbi:hypothetical protein BH23GEM7_BH23GEM7_06640 [soil metagenome]